MANPSLKKGYIPIANELAEAFMRNQIHGREWRIMWAILRKTWAWKKGGRRKDFDWVSYGQLEQMTGIDRRHCFQIVQDLLDRNLLTKKGKTLGINQDYEKWVSPHKVTGVPLQGGKSVPPQGDYKRKKENIQKKGRKTQNKTGDNFKSDQPETAGDIIKRRYGSKKQKKT